MSKGKHLKFVALQYITVARQGDKLIHLYKATLASLPEGTHIHLHISTQRYNKHTATILHGQISSIHKPQLNTSYLYSMYGLQIMI